MFMHAYIVVLDVGLGFWGLNLACDRRTRAVVENGIPDSRVRHGPPAPQAAASGRGEAAVRTLNGGERCGPPESHHDAQACTAHKVSELLSYRGLEAYVLCTLNPK